MFPSTFQTLEQFKEVLSQLSEANYSRPCSILSDATIGQHTRHIVELYQCLIKGYASAEVCYDKRKRDKRIEQDVNFAIHQLGQIQNTIAQPDKNIFISYNLNERDVIIPSNYNREVMYNLEHTIHHQALIKVAINHFTTILLPDSFGVAPSTMQYRSKCVQ